MKRSLLLLLLAVTAASCASAQAKSPAEAPNLDVPAPPPRVIEPTPVEPPPPEPVAELPAAVPPRTRPTPPASSRETSRETAKPEPKPEPTEPPPAAPPPAPAPQLRTPTVPDGPAAARQIREILDRAQRTLNSIDYQKLTAERQANYNTAKNFIKEGDEALKKADYLYAKELADKADRFAKELQGR